MVMEEDGANSPNPSSYNNGPVFLRTGACEEKDDRLSWNLLGSKYKVMSENPEMTQLQIAVRMSTYSVPQKRLRPL